tara:strand:- start:5338 stop:6768 length:1431 start_codon:yes stop_codon:yes gene_type:complete
MIEHNIKKNVKRTLGEIPVHDRIKPLIVALSGGPDSVALLLALNDLKDELDLKLHIAHMNHGLRGMESDDDERFVIDLANQLGLPYTTRLGNVKDYAKTNKTSIEEAARNIRYEFLSSVVKEKKGFGIVLGHTKNDQVETILMHLIRGTGLNGLLGMSAFSKWQSVDTDTCTVLVRPLLNIDKDSTEKYCSFYNLQPRIDTSNSSIHFTRNKIRADLIPIIKSYNQSFGKALLRMSSAARHYQEYIETITLETMNHVKISAPHGITFSRYAFCEQHRVIQTNLVLLAYKKMVGNTKKIKSAHIDTILDLASNGKSKIVHLPNNLVVCIDNQEIQFVSRNCLAETKTQILTRHIIKVPGKTTIPGWEIVSWIEKTSTTRLSSEYHITLDADQIDEPIFVRGRLPGDKFVPTGMKNTKKLQDFMVDAKIPNSKRDSVPIVTLNDEIIWVVGYRKADGLALDTNTMKVITIAFTATGLY